MTDQRTVELQKITRDLRDSIAWMDLVLANLSESICVLDKSGAIVFANDALADLLGKARILVLGEKLWYAAQLKQSTGLKLHKASLKEAWSAEKAATLNGDYYLGHDVILHINAHYISGLNQMILVMRDVTQEKISARLLDEKITELEKTKKDLETKQEKLQVATAKDKAMLGSIGDSLIATDGRGRIALMNKQAENLFHISAEDVMEEYLVNVVPLLDKQGKVIPREDSPIERALSSGKKVSSAAEDTFFYIRKDDAQLAVAVTVAPIVLDKKLVGAIGIFRDVTKEREIDRMKTEFISLASHQLRTPLSAINWFSDMLINNEAGQLNPEQHDFTKSISESTHRMISLVNGLLNVSRIESGRVIVDPTPTDLNALIKDVISDLKAKITAKRHHVTVHVDPSIRKVKIDPHLISQVYLNLLSNAIKYTPDGGQIHVNITKKDRHILSEVTDNGYGIPKSQHRKVFQKFFRAENIVKIETDGSGLGMYLVKTIVESSQGKIWFESEEGKGSTFWFTLPASGMKAKAGEVILDTEINV